MIALELGLGRSPLLRERFTLSPTTEATIATKGPAACAASAAAVAVKLNALVEPVSTLCDWDWLLRLRRCLVAVRCLVERLPMDGEDQEEAEEEILTAFEARFPPDVFGPDKGSNSRRRRTFADTRLFGLAEDTQLVDWVRARPEDWEVRFISFK